MPTIQFKKYSIYELDKDIKKSLPQEVVVCHSGEANRASSLDSIRVWAWGEGKFQFLSKYTLQTFYSYHRPLHPRLPLKNLRFQHI